MRFRWPLLDLRRLKTILQGRNKQIIVIEVLIGNIQKLSSSIILYRQAVYVKKRVKGPLHIVQIPILNPIETQNRKEFSRKNHLKNLGYYRFIEKEHSVAKNE